MITPDTESYLYAAYWLLEHMNQPEQRYPSVEFRILSRTVHHLVCRARILLGSQN